ncbi:MAG: hypothetical protein FWB91_08455 [Defluviitaleaceae bacterium]|nr:hypothetical protein [Defluviitaleaceae bacterium]
MVLYYTRSKKTKIFAEALAEVMQMPVRELESDLNDKSTFGFMIKALGMAFGGRGYPVKNMPESIPGEIYLCGPVWGGQMVGPPRYFLDNANLTDTKVNLLLTAGVPVEKYRRKALDYLNRIPCKPGEAYIFAASDKVPPEPETIKEQLREILQIAPPC